MRCSMMSPLIEMSFASGPDSKKSASESGPVERQSKGDPGCRPPPLKALYQPHAGECVSDNGQPLQSLLSAEYGLLFVVGYVSSYMLVSMGIFNVILAVYVAWLQSPEYEHMAYCCRRYGLKHILAALLGFLYSTATDPQVGLGWMQRGLRLM